VPVRIIFRGLMLFEMPETGPNARKLVAYLINDAGFGGTTPGHPHDHDAEVQVLTGKERGIDLQPTRLVRHATLDILTRGQSGVIAGSSFDRHVPDLGIIIENATPGVRDAGRGTPNKGLIQNVVMVDGGTVRVKDVMGWDQGAYPLSGDRRERGERPTSPTLVKFVASSVQGHMASEVVVEIDDDEVELRCDHDQRFTGVKQGTDDPVDPHMPARTVEILITNFERPGDKPTPWGLDFQWLFEAAGYNAADLSGPEFEEWVSAGRVYDADLFKRERAMFLRGQRDNETIGRPFPFIESSDALSQLQPLTNVRNILVCVFAKTSTPMFSSTLTAQPASETPKSSALQPAAAKKQAVRKPAVKEAAAKKPSVKKAPAKKSAAKKAPAKKTSAKKAPVRKPAPKKKGRR